MEHGEGKGRKLLIIGGIVVVVILALAVLL